MHGCVVSPPRGQNSLYYYDPAVLCPSVARAYNQFKPKIKLQLNVCQFIGKSLTFTYIIFPNILLICKRSAKHLFSNSHRQYSVFILIICLLLEGVLDTWRMIVH